MHASARSSVGAVSAVGFLASGTDAGIRGYAPLTARSVQLPIRVEQSGPSTVASRHASAFERSGNIARPSGGTQH